MNIFVYVHVSMNVHLGAGMFGGQKKFGGTNFLELELQIVVSLQSWVQARFLSAEPPLQPPIFFFFFFFRDRVSLYSPDCPGTHSEDQAGLELRNPLASAS
jgi:hypothetical protein